MKRRISSYWLKPNFSVIKTFYQRLQLSGLYPFSGLVTTPRLTDYYYSHNQRLKSLLRILEEHYVKRGAFICLIHYDSRGKTIPCIVPNTIISNYLRFSYEMFQTLKKMKGLLHLLEKHYAMWTKSVLYSFVAKYSIKFFYSIRAGDRQT